MKLQCTEKEQIAGKGKAIEVKNLEVRFPVRSGLFRRETAVVRAVDGVTFDVVEGETVGLVGESGSGKTTTGRSLLGLAPAIPGSVRLFGRSLEELMNSRHDLQKIGQLVFQDPFASLNPRLAIGAAISEALYVHGMKDKSARHERMFELLDQVGLRPETATRYPVALSGGQRQRVAIARALAVEPRIMILDEVVSALDVSIQGQILNLLMDLQKTQKLSFLFITHDLSVVRYVSHRVVVMYRGCLMEEGETESVFRNPKHPYTHSLLSAVPVPNPATQRFKRKMQIRVEAHNLTSVTVGCRFQGSCPHADDLCRNQEPEILEVSRRHRVACHHWAKIPDFSVG
ncbi:MAG: oligopeptide transport system ATP-binding protein [Rhodobacteraceae bacterium HLUCCA12]|nr:MAG: oligopeptide transport system ATP-binding protein [Rhodobacteraceae bacterium HLUCCA12]